ncbi:MAG TPA: hypothetical protein VF375_01070 [Candidatus Limnocylindrales bacterium]
MTPDRSRCLESLAELILAVERPHPVRVAVDGPDAAGKTILADELAPILERSARPIIRASIDGFHRRRAERIARGPDSPEGYYRDSFDYPALRAALLHPLGPGGNLKFRRRVFDYRTDSPALAPVETAAPDSILLFDGVFLLRPELADLWNFAIFVSVPFKETQRRAAERDAVLFGPTEATLRRYAARYVPGQQIYFEEAHPEAAADVVIANEDPDRPLLHRRGELDR